MVVWVCVRVCVNNIKHMHDDFFPKEKDVTEKLW